MDTGLRLHSAPRNSLVELAFERLVEKLEVTARSCYNVHVNNHVVNWGRYATVLCGAAFWFPVALGARQRQRRSLTPSDTPITHNHIAIVSRLKISLGIRDYLLEQTR